jgi:PAS domain S-box-containing protein
MIALLGGLEVRDEELQVVSEELRVQQEQITALLGRHDAEVRWRSNLAALVPVGLAVTDGNGKLLEANPALATALGVSLARLRGKPLPVFLAPEDAAAFRNALRALTAAGGTHQHLTATVRPRGGAARPSDLFGFTEVGGVLPSAARVQWVVAPVDPEQGGHLADGELEADDMTGLAAAFAEMSVLPVAEPDRQRMLSRMATLVGSAVPGTDWVSISLGSPLDPQQLGSDSAEAQDFDGRQMQAREGPCLEAHLTGRPVLTGDVTADERWPRLRAVAGEAAVRSVLAVPVKDGGEGSGVLNLYAGRPDAFGPATRRIGELAAAAATGVLQTVAERESLRALAANLEQALTSRAVIDQAKGILMAHLGVDADEAFARLVRLSSHLNVKLRDVARHLVEGNTDLIAAAGA